MGFNTKKVVEELLFCGLTYEDTIDIVRNMADDVFAADKEFLKSIA